METKEKNLEQDIESWLLNEGGYVKGTMATYDKKRAIDLPSQTDDSVIVPFEMAQIPNVLFATGWTNHQIILNRCKTDTERLFYMLYAGKERLENKELMRAIKTDTMNSLLGGKNVQSKVMANTYPDAPLLFKDKVFLEMLGLPLEFLQIHFSSQYPVSSNIYSYSVPMRLSGSYHLRYSMM